jgi:hypothetical protein
VRTVHTDSVLSQPLLSMDKEGHLDEFLAK